MKSVCECAATRICLKHLKSEQLSACGHVYCESWGLHWVGWVLWGLFVAHTDSLT